METLEQLKEIYDNKPDGATHVGNDLIYYQYEKADRVAIWREFTKHKTSFVLNQCICMFGLRSLSDIKLIIKLMEGQKKAYQAYAVLEEVKQKYNGENKIAKELLKLAYECDEFALPGDLRKDIKNFIGDL